jgi:hypothetical protein
MWRSHWLRWIYEQSEHHSVILGKWERLVEISDMLLLALWGLNVRNGKLVRSGSQFVISHEGGDLCGTSYTCPLSSVTQLGLPSAVNFFLSSNFSLRNQLLKNLALLNRYPRCLSFAWWFAKVCVLGRSFFTKLKVTHCHRIITTYYKTKSLAGVQYVCLDL